MSLAEHPSSAIVAVKDLERARRFYRDTLGLTPLPERMGVLQFRTGSTSLVVYPSAEAGTNRANAVVWSVGSELRSIVKELGSRGVKFERYDFPDTTFRDGIHESGGFLMAWFKDPDGNILHINGDE